MGDLKLGFGSMVTVVPFFTPDINPALILFPGESSFFCETDDNWKASKLSLRTDYQLMK